MHKSLQLSIALLLLVQSLLMAQSNFEADPIVLNQRDNAELHKSLKKFQAVNLNVKALNAL